MSLPSGGSTAPAITSPLLAWPSRPSQRERSPLSTPSSGTFQSSSSYPSILSSQASGTSSSTETTRASSWESQRRSAKGKGKAVDLPEVRVVQDPRHDREGRKYPPPKRPLSPRQLGRIAQSFGIVVPSLPSANSSPSGSPSSSRTPQRRFHSPYLLCVIPPIFLLNLETTSAVESEKRRRRWKRGRLLSLQPTLGAMLLSIAREYGLPSTTGLNIYLVQNRDDRSSDSETSFGDVEEATGPLISSPTWSTLFANYTHSLSPRAISPLHTPPKLVGQLGRDVPFPLSPLSLLSEPRSTAKDPRKPFAESTPVKPSPASLAASSQSPPRFPPSPGSDPAFSPIVGTIEFEVDTDVAGWFEEWVRTGRGRKMSSTSDGGGIRELRLVRKTQTGPRRFPFDPDTADRYSIDSDSRLSYLTRRTKAARPSPSEVFALLQRKSSQSGERLTISLPPSKALSSAGSLGELTELDTSGEISAEDLESEVMATLQVPENQTLDLSALSVEARERLQVVVDKRGSAMVMSEQLEDLEKIMRQLSPRDIRLTSPRMLTPRMAAKVADLQLPPVPKARGVPISRSPLAEAFKPEAAFEKSGSSANATATDATIGSGASAWPAVPFVTLTDSPGSASIDELAKDRASSPGLSEETLKRMQASPPKSGSAEWRPSRPTRPVSPNIAAMQTITQSVDPEIADSLRSPTARMSDSPTSPASPAEDGRPKLRNRSGSISLKGLRHMGSKTFQQWRKDGDAPPVPSKEPLGLFRAPISPQGSTFPGLRERGSSTPPGQAGEFGMSATDLESPPLPSSGSLPSKADGPRGFGRLLHPFGRRTSDGPSKKHSKRNGSVDGPVVISAPIAGSFSQNSVVALLSSSSGLAQVDEAGGADGGPLSRVPTRGADPLSPKSVKRKPVPVPLEGEGVREDGEGKGAEGQRGMNGDARLGSIGSLGSFVLGEPPKRRVPMGTAL